MANLNVSYDQMQDACNKLNAGKDQIVGQLDNLRGQINSLTSSGFVTDRASGAFNEAYMRYDQGAKSTIDGLNDVVTFLQRVVNTMRETDMQLAGTIK